MAVATGPSGLCLRGSAGRRRLWTLGWAIGIAALRNKLVVQVGALHCLGEVFGRNMLTEIALDTLVVCVAQRYTVLADIAILEAASLIDWYVPGYSEAFLRGAPVQVGASDSVSVVPPSDGFTLPPPLGFVG